MKQRFFSNVKRFAVAGATLAVLLFGSCSNLVEQEQTPAAPEQTVQAGEKVQVRISVAETARSAYPTVNRDEFVSFTLKCDDTIVETWHKDAETGLSAYQMLSAGSVELTTGEHELELIAELDGGVRYKSEITQTITANATLAFRLTLAEIPATGKGTFSWEITFPSDKDLTKVTCDMYASEDGSTYGDTPAYSTFCTVGSSSTPSISWTSSLSDIAAGKYIVVYTFCTSDGNNHYEVLGTYEESVVVIPGRTTSYTETIVNLNSRYTITYKLNGGNGTSIRYYSSQNDVEHQIPTKTNLTFAGWYTTEDFTGEPQTGWLKRTRIGDLTLYAKWTYTLTFSANDTTEAPAEGEIESETAIEGIGIKVPECAFTREGYAFTGWNTNANGSGTFYEAGSTLTSNGHIMLYAQWTERAEGQVSVTYHANGGTRIETQMVAAGSTLSAPVVERTGYELVGWFTSTDGGETLSDTAFVFGENGTTVSADTVLYAKWTPKTYHITYCDVDSTLTDKEFSGTHETGYATTHTYDTVTALDTPTAPDDDRTFIGWFTSSKGTGTALTELSATGYTADITLYAKYLQTKYHVSAEGDNTSGTGLTAAPYKTVAKAVTAIVARNTKTDYTIVVHGTVVENVTITMEASYASSLTICGATGNETDKLDGNGNGTVLKITSAVPITLKNIAITKGTAADSCTGGGITLDNSIGHLTLGSGALITGNRSAKTSTSTWSSYGYYYGGGGIYVYSGTLVMEDGSEISGNEANSAGGGVFVCGYSSGTSFVMNGGVIKDNTVTTSSTKSNYCYGGGGVYVFGYATSGTSFIMNGGEIKNNTVPNASANTHGGGGVYLYCRNPVTFTMTGGTISGNSAYYGGGVYANYYSSRTNCKFTLEDGEISGNTATKNGGGVYVYAKATMTNGKITKNTAGDAGGGVYVVSNATFSMSDGEISENKATNYGDGIYVVSNGIFSVSGGKISDNDEYAVYCTATTFKMGGSAYIPLSDDGNNTVYFSENNSLIDVTDELTATAPVATIQPKTSNYTKGYKVIAASGITMSQELADKFAIKSDGTPWIVGVDSDGYGVLARPVYEITYKDKDGEDFTGTLPADASLTHTYDTPTTLPIPDRDGWAFQGWHKLPDCSDPTITSIGARDITAGITLYTYWTHEVVNFSIKNAGIDLDAKEVGGVVTVTASDGYTGYGWLIDGKEPEDAFAGAKVSADGKTLTFGKAAMIRGLSYVISVTAKNTNGVVDHATVTVKKQEAE